MEDDGRPDMLERVVLGACVLLTLLAVFVCVRIEIYNIQVGGYLPRTDFGEGNPKWRVISGEGMRRMMMSRAKSKAEAAGKPFKPTPEFLQEVERKAARAEVECHFRSFVSSWGLIQYLLLPVVLFMGLLIGTVEMFTKGTRITGVTCSVVALICGFFMFYRGYFPALGW
jgi:hypothetical protein